ncbi:MAG: helix-turn-helix transcriptional regulator [Oscillospiraceae bacterium]|nr:helix-turn-helix transcriptional regulator [Oscillospiraceae bacterium]
MSASVGILRGETPPHKHKNYEIVVCTKGMGQVYFDENPVPVVPGTILVVPPGVSHSSSGCDDSYERIYIGGVDHMFHLSDPAVISEDSGGEGLLLANLIFRNRYAEEEYISALVHAFGLFVLQKIKMYDKVFLAVQAIAEYISREFHNSDMDLNAVLKRSGYTEDYIRANFKRITGKTPTEFLTQARIHHACYLIGMYKDTLPLTEIAERCGYVDYIYFSRRFRQEMGVSPRQYRKEN